MERSPTALLAPVSASWPPANFFAKTVLPESRTLAGITMSRSSGLSSIEGSMRCYDRRFAISVVGCTARNGPGAWWMQ